MKKEFLTGLGLEADAIDKIMAENGKDIEREKAKYSDRDELSKQLTETKKQLDDLKALNPEELKLKTEELSKQLEKVQAESVAKLAQIETQGKIKDFLSGKKFVNDITRDAIASKMSDSLNGEASKGKSFDDIFGELTKDAKNILLDDNAPKPPVQTSMTDLPATGASGVEQAFMKLNPTLKL